MLRTLTIFRRLEYTITVDVPPDFTEDEVAAEIVDRIGHLGWDTVAVLKSEGHAVEGHYVPSTDEWDSTGAAGHVLTHNGLVSIDAYKESQE